MTLPSEWEEYDDEEERTSAFFNAKSWTGNLRVIPFRWSKLNNQNDDKISQYISKELEENEGATNIKLGDFNCVHYKKELIQDGEEFVIYYWTAWEKNNLFVCSFTVNKKKEHTKQNNSEISIVQDIIKSIRIN